MKEEQSKSNKSLLIKTVLMGILLFLIVPVLIMLLLALLSGNTIFVCAAGDNPFGAPCRIESTAYCHGEVTAGGHEVREGIAAGRREWIGQTAIVYADDNGSIGELIGIYEVLDTGGDVRIQNGECIDIYMPDYAAAKEYGRRDVWVQIVDAKG